MKKTYDIIPLNGFLYAVEDQTNIVPVCYLFRDNWPEGREKVPEIIHLEKGSYWPYGTGIKIIATNDPSLGLPLLPPVEEDIEQLALEVFPLVTDMDKPRGSAQDLNKDSRLAWLKGYKAASENMIKALGWMAHEVKTNGFGGHSVSYSKGRHFYENKVKPLFKPIPKAIEVKMIDEGEEEWMGDDYTGEPFWNEHLVPEVENGFVKIIKYIYA